MVPQAPDPGTESEIAPFLVKIFHHDKEVSVSTFRVPDVIFQDSRLIKVQLEGRCYGSLFDSNNELGYQLLDSQAGGKSSPVEYHEATEPLMTVPWVDHYS